MMGAPPPIVPPWWPPRPSRSEWEIAAPTSVPPPPSPWHPAVMHFVPPPEAAAASWDDVADPRLAEAAGKPHDGGGVDLDAEVEDIQLVVSPEFVRHLADGAAQRRRRRRQVEAEAERRAHAPHVGGSGGGNGWGGEDDGGLEALMAQRAALQDYRATLYGDGLDAIEALEDALDDAFDAMCEEMRAVPWPAP